MEVKCRKEGRQSTLKANREEPRQKQLAHDEGSTSSKPQPSRDIKCFWCLGTGQVAFECPNNRAMIMQENGEIESWTEEDSDYESIPALEDVSDVEYLEGANILFTRTTLNTQGIEEEGDEIQCENIIYTSCLIHDKAFNVIIDGWGFANMVSSILVEKLNLPTLKYPRPYNLQWLNECGEIKITKQV